MTTLNTIDQGPTATTKAAKDRNIPVPAVNSLWRWSHLTEPNRRVTNVFTNTYGTYILYEELSTNGNAVDLKLTSIKSWEKALKGLRPYNSKLQMVDAAIAQAAG